MRARVAKYPPRTTFHTASPRTRACSFPQPRYGASVRLHNELRLRPIAPLVHHDILDFIRAGRDRFPEPLFFYVRLGMVVPHVFEDYLHQRLFVIGPQAMATVAQGGAQNRAHLGTSFPFWPTRKPHPSLGEIAGCATSSTRPSFSAQL